MCACVYLSVCLSPALQSAIKERDLETLEAAIKAAKTSSVAPELHEGESLPEAESLRSLLQRLKRYLHKILEMKQPTVSEIHSYKRPRPLVHTVMKATYILLGEREKQLQVSARGLSYSSLSYSGLFCPSLSGPSLSYPILFCTSLSYLILSYPSLFYPSLSYPSLFYPSLSYPSLSYSGLFCPSLSGPSLSFPILFCTSLSYLSCPTLACSTLACPTLACPSLACPTLACRTGR